MANKTALVGFKKNGKEILVYRINENTYVDVFSKEIISIDEIDLLSLRIYSNNYQLFIGQNFKSDYKKSRKELLKTNEFILGERYKVTKFLNFYTGSGWNARKHYQWLPEYRFSEFYECIDKIEIRLESNFYICRNLMGEEFYGYQVINEPDKLFVIPNFQNGLEYIALKEKTLEDLTNQSIMDRKSVNEFNYCVKKKSLSMKGDGR